MLRIKRSVENQYAIQAGFTSAEGKVAAQAALSLEQNPMEKLEGAKVTPAGLASIGFVRSDEKLPGNIQEARDDQQASAAVSTEAIQNEEIDLDQLEASRVVPSSVFGSAGGIYEKLRKTEEEAEPSNVPEAAPQTGGAADARSRKVEEFVGAKERIMKKRRVEQQE